MSKVTVKELESLQELLLKAFQTTLSSGEYTAADLSQIRQFLKDNKMEVTSDNPQAIKLLKDLPFDDDQVEKSSQVAREA